MVERDTTGTRSLLCPSIVAFLRVCASNNKALLKVAFDHFPERSILNLYDSFGRLEVVLLGHTARDVDHTLTHLTTVQKFILFV